MSIAPPLVSTDFNNPQNNYGFQSLVLDPVDPRVLFVGTNYQGLWKSTDQGGTWKKINTGVGGNLLDQGRLWTLAIDPFNHNTLWTTSGYGAGGPLKSTDGGVSWALAPVGSPTQNNDVCTIFIDPFKPNHLLIGWHTPWTTDNQNSGVSESNDGGATWTNHQPPSGSNWGSHVSVWFLDNSHTWLVGSDTGGIWRTTNSGASWTQVRTQSVSHGGTNGLYRDAATGVIYLTGGNNAGGYTSVAISQDDGVTWTEPPGLPFAYYGAVVTDGTNLYTAPAFPVATYVDGPWYYLPLKNGTSWKPYNAQHTCYRGNCNGPSMTGYDPINHIAYAVNELGGVWKHAAAAS